MAYDNPTPHKTEIDIWGVLRFPHSLPVCGAYCELIHSINLGFNDGVLIFRTSDDYSLKIHGSNRSQMDIPLSIVAS